MKPAQLFHQYVWLINTLKSCGALTLGELNRKWQDDHVAEGNPLKRSSFNRHRDAILDMFGVIIDCNKTTYRYYISNPEVLADNSMERWLFSTLTVHGVLADCSAVKERVMLENVPAGLEFLDVIIQAIKTNHCLLISYRKFGTEGYVKTVCPYVLKLFRQRWYLLARKQDDGQMRIYALDRMCSVSLTDEHFALPQCFSSQEYFSDYYGVLTDGTPPAHIVVRTYGKTPDYLRTLPLHHSQREMASTADYTDFSLDLRPTADFLAQLLSYGDGLEVLQPEELRRKMREKIVRSLKRY